jgi:hypothetical protein
MRQELVFEMCGLDLSPDYLNGQGQQRLILDRGSRRPDGLLFRIPGWAGAQIPARL